MEKELQELSKNANFRNGIVVDTIAHKNPYDTKVLHRHNYHEILVFEKGKGNQIIDFNQFEIKDKTLYWIQPGQVHWMKKLSTKEGISIQFTHEFLCLHFSTWFQDWASIILNQNEYLLREEKITLALTLSKNLLESFKEKGEFGFQKTKGYLGLLLVEIIESMHRSTVPLDTSNSITNKFMRIVHQQVQFQRKVQQYASQLHITTNVLNKNVKKATGKSPKDIIQEALLLAIKRSMCTESRNHKALFLHYHFDSQNSYNRFIKQQSGLTPSQLREQLLQKHK